MLLRNAGFSLLALFAGGALGHAGGADDLKAIQGTWFATFIRHDGKVVYDLTSDPSLPKLAFIFEKHTPTSMTLSFSGAKEKFVLTVDPAKTPKSMDLHLLDEKTGAKGDFIAHKAIYEMKDAKTSTTLTIFLGVDSTKARPAGLPTTEGAYKGMRLIRLTRPKAASEK